ncbi:MAG: YdcF family protein [Sphingomonas sp.]
MWTPAELDAIATIVSGLGKNLLALPVVRGDSIEAAVRRELGGINHVLGTYGLGAAPRYPKIDSAVWPASSKSFRDSVTTALAIAETSRTSQESVFGDSWQLALALLEVNDRTEAITFEPLDEGENAAAIRAAAKIDWSKYRYTAIIVPGAGPEDPDTPLSPGGKLRVALAVARFRAGLAPFLLVSGGNVHPNRTRFNEAVEMRRALVERFGIPAERVVIDPYARHTTTNLRNAVRRLAAMKAPLDKPALIVTSKDQLAYILGATFTARNQQELGYQPGTPGAAISDVEAPFLPSARSLAIDPIDPLDP